MIDPRGTVLTVIAINDLRQVPHVAGKLIADKLAVNRHRDRRLGTEEIALLRLFVAGFKYHVIGCAPNPEHMPRWSLPCLGFLVIGINIYLT
jgi:hypothetical protein